MSKEQIIKDLPETFVRQMRDWVATGAGIGHVTISSAYEGMPGNTVFGPSVPSGAGESSHVERAIDALPTREKLAVSLFWIYEDNEFTWLMRRLHVTDPRTLENRIRKGHQLLRADLARREAAYERMIDARPAA